jgi:hypothetical protein
LKFGGSASLPLNAALGLTGVNVEVISTEFQKDTHQIPHDLYFLDVHRLLCYFLASPKLAEISEDMRIDHIAFSRSDISRLLVSIAASFRVKSDDGTWEHAMWLHNKYGGVGKLNKNVHNTEANFVALEFREACNKILHAEMVTFDIARSDNGSEILNPYVYLHGSRGKLSWRAELDIVAFCLAAQNIVV